VSLPVSAARAVQAPQAASSTALYPHFPFDLDGD
jgi:hypothetical protein